MVYKPPLQITLQTLDAPDFIAGDKVIDLRVLKIRYGGKIYLEFLARQPNDSYILINSLEIKGTRDAYFEYWGETSSLILLDNDGDGVLDVMAPTFDTFFLPNVNVAAYNQTTHQFELQQSESSPKVIPPDFRIMH